MKPAIVLRQHDARWPGLFEAEREAILSVCGDLIGELHHIGSTSIPGIAAKPIIDILATLGRHEDGWACTDAMARLGYEYRGDGGVDGRHYFRKGNPQTHHVHMFARDHPAVSRGVRFRDYLRTHPKEAHAYEVLKRELAARFVTDTLSYSNAKSDFCGRIDRLALASKPAP